MITIFQIRTTKEQADAFNAGASDPAIEAKRKLMFGANKFDASMLKYFTAVADVYTNDLEQAFEATNIPTGIEVDRFGKMHSASVGDIFAKDGRFFMVDMWGFQELRLFTDEIEMIGEAA